VSPPEDESGPPRGAGAEITGTEIEPILTEPSDDGRRHRSTMRRLARDIRWLETYRHWWILDLEWRQRAGKAS
jgi:hypothetical protein